MKIYYNRRSISSAEEYCHQTCHSREMDRGIDDFVYPCNYDLWTHGDHHWDDNDHHWEDNDHHWEDNDHHWDDNDHHWDHNDHHWDDNDHHWDHNDHDWNQNFAFAGLGCKQSKDTQE